MYNNVQVACVCVCEFGCFVEENQLTPMMNAVAAFVPMCDNKRRFYVFFKCEGNAKPKREREKSSIEIQRFARVVCLSWEDDVLGEALRTCHPCPRHDIFCGNGAASYWARL